MTITFRDVSVQVATPITAAMITSSTISEPDTGETAWATSTAYVVGDVRIRTATHRKYRCLVAHTSAASPTPENDTVNWQDIGPTNKYAAFDAYKSTQSESTTSEQWVITPGVFNSIGFFAMEGDTVDVLIKDAPGGATVYDVTHDLVDPPLDWWDYLFGTLRTRDRLVITNLSPYANPEVTITVAGATGATVKAGMIQFGDLRSLLPEANRGGPLHGATAEPVDFSWVKVEDDGSWQVKRRRNARDIRMQVVIPREQADYALATLEQVLGVPSVFVGSTASGYAGLTGIGLGSGSIAYANHDHSVLTLYVKGLV